MLEDVEMCTRCRYVIYIQDATLILYESTFVAKKTTCRHMTVKFDDNSRTLSIIILSS